MNIAQHCYSLWLQSLPVDCHKKCRCKTTTTVICFTANTRSGTPNSKWETQTSEVWTSIEVCVRRSEVCDPGLEYIVLVSAKPFSFRKFRFNYRSLRFDSEYRVRLGNFQFHFRILRFCCRIRRSVNSWVRLLCGTIFLRYGWGPQSLKRVKWCNHASFRKLCCP